MLDLLLDLGDDQHVGLQSGVSFTQIVSSKLLDLQLGPLARLVFLFVRLVRILLRKAPSLLQVIYLMLEGVAEPNRSEKERG